ncbi:MAG TPA: ATP-binding protein [Bacteroidota bacterium]|jgi:signal transduction histidine kinase|nr:ATP-binding protein [Bacteroidota bacterium]
MESGGTLNLMTGRENGSIVFFISDTGSGILSERRDKIFDGFVTAGKKNGTGLGLAITKRRVNRGRGRSL